MTVECTLSESELKFLAAKYVMETLDIKGEPTPYEIKENNINITRLTGGEYTVKVMIEARKASEEPQENNRLVGNIKDFCYT